MARSQLAVEVGRQPQPVAVQLLALEQERVQLALPAHQQLEEVKVVLHPQGPGLLQGQAKELGLVPKLVLVQELLRQEARDKVQ